VRRWLFLQQPMFWRLLAKPNLPGSSGLPIIPPFFDFFVLTME
jgi:hypothetical protein